MINIAIIGFGYWGKNLVRNFYKQEGCRIKYLVEIDKEKTTTFRQQYPNILTTNDLDIVLNDEEIQAIVIATPISTHYSLTLKALNANKHVLCEKPLVQHKGLAIELTNLAKKKEKVLMVDYTFLYTGAVKKIKEIIQQEALGKPLYLDSVRINLGIFQTDANVVADLATHDLSILLYLFEAMPLKVKAEGVSHTSNNITNLAYITLYYEDGFIAHLHCSWTSPVKIRQILIGGSQKMIVYNDMEPSEKIKIYEANMPPIHEDDALRTKTLTDYRVGDIYIPKLDTVEALDGLAKDFLQCMTSNKHQPKINTTLIDKVATVLEACQSALQTGEEVIL